MHDAPLRVGWSVVLLTGILAALPHDITAAEPQGEGLHLPPQLDLPTLISVIGEFTGTSLHFSPQKISGNARLDIRGHLGTTDAWSLLNQVLLQHGFTTVIAGHPPVYHVVPIAEAEATGLVFTDAESVSAVAPPPGFITMVRSIVHVGPEVVVQTVGPALGPRTQVRGIGREVNRLLLAGERERVLAVNRLIDALDRPGNETGMRTFQPRFASGAKLQRSLSAAWSAAGKITGQPTNLEVQLLPDGQRLLLIGTADDLPKALALLNDLDRAEPTQARTYRSEHFRMEDVAKLIEEVLGSTSDDQRIKVVRDRLTGGLVVTASETQHLAIQSLLKELAAAPAGSRASVRAFTVKHRQATELAAVLRELTSNGITDVTGSAADVPTPPPSSTPATSTATVPSGEHAEATFTVDTHTNTLIVMAQPRLIDHITSLIDRLDRRQPQVQVEITLVILSQGETQALGFEWAAIARKGADTLSIAQLFGLSEQGDNITDRTPGGTGLTSLIINPGDYAGLVQALQTVNKGRSMVTTMTVVDNNAEAAINAVLQQPVSNINANNNVATTTFGGTSDAGTQITVKPLINAADQVQLTFSVSQSSFVGETITTENGGVLPPPRRQDSIASVATIPDGHVIALGGLTNENDSDGSAGVPFLSRVPLLGTFFKNTTQSTSSSRFFLFIRADVLRHPLYEDLRHRSRPIAGAAGIPAESGPVLVPRFVD